MLTASLFTPPSVLIDWSPTSLTTAFLAYNVWRRPSRAPVRPWVKVGSIRVPPVGLTATQVEANHTAWIDYEPGWYRDAAGQWADGWDYAVTVQSTKNLESIFGTIMSNVIVPSACNAWVCCNAAPWLNSPMQVVPSGNSESDHRQVIRRYTGRDLAVQRTPKERPDRRFSAQGLFFATVGPDQLRYLRAAEHMGRAMTLLRQNGDKVTGGLAIPKWADADGGAQYQDITLQLTETLRAPELADYNLPSGAVLNGSSQRITVPDSALLDPASQAWTFFVYAVAPAVAASKTFLAKRVSGDGFALEYDGSSVLSAIFDGTSVATLTDGTWSAQTAAVKAEPHLWLATTTGTVQKFYRDETLVDSDAVAHGAIANTEVLSLGARSGGTQFAALNPGYAWGVFPRALTETEIVNLRRYLAGYPGYRLPIAPNGLWDLRDKRSNQGTSQVVDLSGNGQNATLVASPVVAGYPWELEELEAF